MTMTKPTIDMIKSRELNIRWERGMIYGQPFEVYDKAKWWFRPTAPMMGALRCHCEHKRNRRESRVPK